MSYSRFIPIRENSLEYSRLLLSQQSNECKDPIHAPTRYERALSSALFEYDIETETRVLPLRPRGPKTTPEKTLSETQPSICWKVQHVSSNTLPGICNDAYFNPFALSESRNALCGVNENAFLINLSTRKGTLIHRGGISETISATHWKNTTTAVIGSSKSILSIVDADTSELTKEYALNAGTINVIGNGMHGNIYAGCKSGTLSRIDPRIQSAITLPIFNQQISSFASDRLLAIGSNNNTIKIVDPRKMEREVTTLSGHQSAVTSVSWLNSNHLISSGGVLDKTIRVWCLHSEGEELMQVNTGSQVTTLTMLSNSTFLSTHGFLSTESDKIQLWNIRDRNLRHLQNIPSSHEERILFSAFSNGIFLTGSAKDSLLNTWDVSKS